MMDPLFRAANLGRIQDVAEKATPKGDGSFSNVFLEAIERVQGARQESNEKIQSLLAGETEDIHQVALSAQKAELAFELAQQVRNKVVSAYQEVMRMQL